MSKQFSRVDLRDYISETGLVAADRGEALTLYGDDQTDRFVEDAGGVHQVGWVYDRSNGAVREASGVSRLVAGAVDVRYEDVKTIPEAVARYGGVANDYAIGVYSPGAVRDPDTGLVSEPAPAILTQAQMAAGVILTPVQFWGALATTLAQPLDAVEAHVDAAIAASSALTDAQKATARFFMSKAVAYHRADENQALLEAIGGELAITPAQLDALFIAAGAP